jgi:hypothetical protein
MGLYTGTIKNLHRAPYREQVLSHLVGWGCGDTLSDADERKIERVQRFLHAADCAREIRDERDRAA